LASALINEVCWDFCNSVEYQVLDNETKVEKEFDLNGFFGMSL
jgi:hypothetical protein